MQCWSSSDCVWYITSPYTNYKVKNLKLNLVNLSMRRFFLTDSNLFCKKKITWGFLPTTKRSIFFEGAILDCQWIWLPWLTWQFMNLICITYSMSVNLIASKHESIKQTILQTNANQRMLRPVITWKNCCIWLKNYPNISCTWLYVIGITACCMPGIRFEKVTQKIGF